MHAGIGWWAKSLSLCAVRWKTNMNSVLVDFTSKIGFNKSLRGVWASTQHGICQEETFRYLLKAEHQRAQRSGHGYYILLVYKTNDQGMVVRMDSYLANEVFNALARSLRETDYIGWYREGHIAGGVLTVVGQDCVGDVNERLQQRLKGIIQNNPDRKSGSFYIRLCRQHELQEMHLFGDKVVAVQ